MQNQWTQQLNMIMGKLSEGSQTEADLQASKKEVANSKLLDLLKKTLMQVSSLENEIQRVEAENIHQERLHKKTEIIIYAISNSVCEFLSQTKNWKNCFW